jgi:AraC-like DNA-binding protein
MRTLLTAWQHTSEGLGSTILPDGCQDLIGRQRPGQRTQWLVAPLAEHAYMANAVPGERFRGYRLRPGTQMDAARLLTRMAGKDLDDDAAAHAALHDGTRLDTRIGEALEALAQTLTLRQAQSWLGVGERSLQRLMTTHSGRPPLYWHRLARWRRTLRLLETDAPLADVAAAAGYADQSHMNRECRQWAGLSPLRLRQLPELLELGRASGHG